MNEQPQPPPVPRLDAIYFNPTQDCNLKCPHCWVDPRYVPVHGPGGPVKRPREPHEITADIFQALIREARPLGLRRVKFTGGEPFLRSDLSEFFEVLGEEKLTYDLETNGTLITARHARRLAATGASQVAVSLDSATPAFHDRFRGVPGTHRRAVRGVLRLLGASLRVQIIFSLMKDNREELEAVVAEAKRLGAHSVKINPIAPGGRGRQMVDKGMGLTAAELVDLLPYAERTLSEKYGLPVILSIPISFQGFDVIRRDRFGRCNILNIMGVLSDGSFSICGIGKEEPDLVMGRFPERSVEDVWQNGKVFLELREKLPRKLEGVCGRCILKGVCLGHCRANAYTLDKNLMAPFWFCEEARAAGVLPPSREISPQA